MYMYQTIKHTFIASSLCFILVGCDKAGGPGYSKTAKTYSLQGCAAGGILGGILGATLGKGDNAGRAAAFGCAIGAYIGYRIAQRTTQYTNAQQAVEEEIARNKRNTAGVRANNQRLTKQITQYKNRIALVKKETKSEKDKNDRLKSTKDHLTETINKATGDLNALNKELITTKELQVKYTKQSKKVNNKVIIKKQKAKDWSKEIASLEREKIILSKHVTSLTALNDSI